MQTNITEYFGAGARRLTTNERALQRAAEALAQMFSPPLEYHMARLAAPDVNGVWMCARLVHRLLEDPSDETLVTLCSAMMMLEHQLRDTRCIARDGGDDAATLSRHIHAFIMCTQEPASQPK